MNDCLGQQSESYALTERTWELLLDHYWHHSPDASVQRLHGGHGPRRREPRGIEPVHTAARLWLSWHGMEVREEDRP